MNTCPMFTIPCERLQVVVLVSLSAVEEVVVDVCHVYSFTTNDCRQSEMSCCCCAGVQRFRTSCVLGRPEPAAISGSTS